MSNYHTSPLTLHSTQRLVDQAPPVLPLPTRTSLDTHTHAGAYLFVSSLASCDPDTRFHFATEEQSEASETYSLSFFYIGSCYSTDEAIEPDTWEFQVPLDDDDGVIGFKMCIPDEGSGLVVCSPPDSANPHLPRGKIILCVSVLEDLENSCIVSTPSSIITMAPRSGVATPREQEEIPHSSTLVAAEAAPSSTSSNTFTDKPATTVPTTSATGSTLSSPVAIAPLQSTPEKQHSASSPFIAPTATTTATATATTTTRTSGLKLVDNLSVAQERDLAALIHNLATHDEPLLYSHKVPFLKDPVLINVYDLWIHPPHKDGYGNFRTVAMGTEKPVYFTEDTYKKILTFLFESIYAKRESMQDDITLPTIECILERMAPATDHTTTMSAYIVPTLSRFKRDFAKLDVVEDRQALGRKAAAAAAGIPAFSKKPTAAPTHNGITRIESGSLRKNNSAITPTTAGRNTATTTTEDESENEDDDQPVDQVIHVDRPSMKRSATSKRATSSDTPKRVRPTKSLSINPETGKYFPSRTVLRSDYFGGVVAKSAEYQQLMEERSPILFTDDGRGFAINKRTAYVRAKWDELSLTAQQKWVDRVTRDIEADPSIKSSLRKRKRAESTRKAAQPQSKKTKRNVVPDSASEDEQAENDNGQDDGTNDQSPSTTAVTTTSVRTSKSSKSMDSMRHIPLRKDVPEDIDSSDDDGENGDDAQDGDADDNTTTTTRRGATAKQQPRILVPSTQSTQEEEEQAAHRRPSTPYPKPQPSLHSFSARLYRASGGK